MSCDDGESMAQCGDCGQAIPASHMHCKDCAEYVKSILDIDISPGFFSVGPWGKKLVTVEGENLSLDDIEHRILRPIWKDPRIHYAVNCASVGCPNLLPMPFSGEALDRMLNSAARAFINGGQSVWFDEGALGASSIYKWYSDDFGRNDREIISHIAKYGTSMGPMPRATG